MLLAFPAERDGSLEIDVITAIEGSKVYKAAEDFAITGAMLSTEPDIVSD